MLSRKRHRRQRIISKIYRRYNRLNIPINNGDTLRRIASLPQQITNDLPMNQFFNGFILSFVKHDLEHNED
ncbi:hypothetical protein RhiirA4_484738 [Rhizophagus irregularis]|uniref:Uncharacterized protein n=1 Tax=Rhizophagus irregularis TaxID=588596 RepID=A0A2I1HP92_9GLOM|nr:hypothetical protein RhiirA4_484738 [Rhizophagus irregularis]